MDGMVSAVSDQPRSWHFSLPLEPKGFFRRIRGPAVPLFSDSAGVDIDTAWATDIEKILRSVASRFGISWRVACSRSIRLAFVANRETAR